MKPLRARWMAVALLCVPACADLAGDDGSHRDCFRKASESKTARPNELGGRIAPALTMGPPAALPALKRAPAATPHETAPEPPCVHDDEPQTWDGTGRAEAVRGT